jgi:hypothetical protein
LSEQNAERGAEGGMDHSDASAPQRCGRDPREQDEWDDTDDQRGGCTIDGVPDR